MERSASGGSASTDDDDSTVHRDRDSEVTIPIFVRHEFVELTSGGGVEQIDRAAVDCETILHESTHCDDASVDRTRVAKRIAVSAIARQELGELHAGRRVEEVGRARAGAAHDRR